MVFVHSVLFSLNTGQGRVVLEKHVPRRVLGSMNTILKSRSCMCDKRAIYEPDATLLAERHMRLEFT